MGSVEDSEQAISMFDGDVSLTSTVKVLTMLSFFWISDSLFIIKERTQIVKEVALSLCCYLESRLFYIYVICTDKILQ